MATADGVAINLLLMNWRLAHAVQTSTFDQNFVENNELILRFKIKEFFFISRDTVFRHNSIC